MKFNSFVTSTNFGRRKYRRPNKAERHPLMVDYVDSEITDADGLERAYKQGDVFIHGDTMYVAGSHTAKDWYDDFTKVPIWGDLRNATRYQKAQEALLANPQISRVVGHSLGGSVALELERNHKQITDSRTYGAPVWELTGSESNGAHRYRNWFDPVSIADRGAQKSWKSDPFATFSMMHDYGNIANNFSTLSKIETQQRNADGSISLFG